jgi:glycosyltransferase involved in cell wall biosynthesis
MRIVQVVLPSASHYERKSQRIDADELARSNEIETLVLAAGDERNLPQRLRNADTVHLYAQDAIPLSVARAIPNPYVSASELASSRFSLRRRPRPPHRISPLGQGAVPEAVAPQFFQPRGTEQPSSRAASTVGVFDGARPDVRRMVDLTRVRLERFRDDVKWTLFQSPPGPEEFRAIDVWFDPATAESDLDGWTAEALVAGLPVVAARTAINSERLNSGRNGLLVPVGDANEMTHAILAALFKPEVREPRREFARLTRDRFRPERRAMALLGIYETIR